MTLRIKTLIIAAVILIAFSIFPLKQIHAAPVTDNTNGVYTDDFSDNTGLETRSGTGVYHGKLQLLNASNGTSTPYVSTGYAITNSIWPQLLAKWGTLTFDVVSGSSTSYMIQVVDGNSELFPDTYLPGNSTGFTSTSLDLSNLNTLITATTSYDGYTKNNRIKFKITLNTSNGSYTPTIDNLNFTWTTTQGDLSSSTLAVSPWPVKGIDSQGTAYTPYYPDSIYPAVKWVKDLGQEDVSDTLIGKNNIIYSKTNGVDYNYSLSLGSNSNLRAINALTGETIWTKEISASARYITLADNNTIYRYEATDDDLCAINGNDGSVKWCYQFYAGHSSETVSLGKDGSVYFAYISGSSVIIYAFRPDGSVKWTRQIDPRTAGDSLEIWWENIVFNSDGNLYTGVIEKDSGGIPNNKGNLYIISHTDGTILHTVDTGDIGEANIVIDKNDVAYVANGCYPYGSSPEEGKILAVNKDGTIKWTYRTGQSIWWLGLALRPDGILLAEEYIYSHLYILNTSDGSLVWDKTDANLYSAQRPSNPFFNGLNGFYTSSRDFVSTTSLNYFDSSYNKKWKFTVPANNPAGTWDYAELRNPVMDSNGNLYTTYYQKYTLVSSPYTTTDDRNYLISLVPWHLSSSGLSPVYYGGDTMVITATSTMPSANPFNNESNIVQAILDNGDKVSLSYSSTNTKGYSIWTGTYKIPESMNLGTHTITIEAAQAMINTDKLLHFSSYPSGSSNTGIATSLTFSIEVANSPLPSGYNIIPDVKASTSIYSLSINEGAASTNNPEVTLKISADPKKITAMAVSEDPTFKNANLIPLATVTPWTLSSGDGTKTVYIKFYNKYGYATDPISASITLSSSNSTDTGSPNSSLPVESEAQTIFNHNQWVTLSETNKKLYDRILAFNQTTISLNAKYAMAYFISNGTLSTRVLGEGERAGVISSFQTAFNKLPTTQADWEDVIKIATGHWPAQISPVSEKNAQTLFQKIYLRKPDMTNPHDNAAVTIMAYGLRPNQRNLKAEKNSINIFKSIFKRNPASAADWDEVRAIAYSGAKR
ncbi:MAG TPA: PQQ-binding-like beta-propeller repeat protein [Candidatus Methylomirabilis sp.]|nr:PQQ-binding-like beta-propeller repeat protein [Candidatus Methylomirabilis sp.]